jgi:hypothetical protein
MANSKEGKLAFSPQAQRITNRRCRRTDDAAVDGSAW